MAFRWESNSPRASQQLAGPSARNKARSAIADPRWLTEYGVGVHHTATHRAGRARDRAAGTAKGPPGSDELLR
jgi:hypothetical protein